MMNFFNLIVRDKEVPGAYWIIYRGNLWNIAAEIDRLSMSETLRDLHVTEVFMHASSYEDHIRDLELTLKRTIKRRGKDIPQNIILPSTIKVGNLKRVDKIEVERRAEQEAT